MENVARVMEKVTVDKRRGAWEEILGGKIRMGWKVLRWGPVKEIYSNHSSEKERLYSCASHLVCKHKTSWKDLVQRLYDYNEMAAAKEAKVFLQQKGR